MLHPSTQNLIDRLAEMTDRGSLNWTEEPDGGVLYATEGYCVTITQDPLDLIITSKDGKELERAAADELSATPAETGGTYAVIVGDMFREASRIARGTETAISSILADIGGQDETPADVTADATEVAEETGAFEDVGDETSIVSATDVEIEETAPEGETEPAAETAAETDPEVADEAVEAEPEAEPVLSEPVSAMPEAEPEMEPLESESEMTAAVAQLARAVNQAQPEPATEPVAETAPEPAVIMTEADPDHTYVPFSLEASAETPAIPVESAVIAAASETLVQETAGPETVEQPVTLETPEPAASFEPAVDAQETDVAEEPITEPTVEAEAPAPTFEPVPATSFTKAQPEPVETFSPEEVAEPVSETPTPIETNPAEPAPAPQSYSLSGIGAGFGLGALTATTEATGVPSAAPAPSAEKIVIDATDDVPFVPSDELEPPQDAATDPGLPDVASLSQPEVADETPAPVADESPEVDSTEEQPALKPRTRFNPWN